MKEIFLIMGISVFFAGCQTTLEEPKINHNKVLTEERSDSAVFAEKNLQPLPDAVAVFEGNKKFLLTDPTDKYKHAVLGDSIEAESLAIIEGENVRKIDFSPQVFEGLFPTLGDLNGDGVQEIIATLSGNGAGAQVAVYAQDGTKLAESDTLSSGWMHVLAVAPFGPNAEPELALVKRPHIDQEVEFYQMRDEKITKVAGLSGYTTHVIGSRNLNLFAVLEDHSESRFVLILPTPDFQSVVAIARTEGGAEELWRKETGERIESIKVLNGEIYVNSKKI